MSKLALSNTGITSNYRSITPPARTGENGIGAYNHETMMNFNYFTGSNGRFGGDMGHFANSGITSGSSTKQITALTGTKPNVFWNGHSYNYSSNKNENFTNQNNAFYYNFWRIGQSGSNVVNDITKNNKRDQLHFNFHVNWDDQLFTIAQTNQGHGNKFNKVAVSTQYQDFSVNRPLIFTLTGGLPRNGEDIYSKEAAVDGGYQTGDHDYYLNYYPKYGGSQTSYYKKSQVGYDWWGINGESGGANSSVYRGYSAVFKEKVNVTTSNHYQNHDSYFIILLL